MLWSPPHDGWVKVNFDANGADGTNRGIGVVIRYNVGKLLVAGVHRYKAQWSIEVSEAAAALFGLEIVVRFGFEYIQLEGDSLNAVSSIEHKVEGSSDIHLLYDCIFSLSNNFKSFGCSFIKRNSNILVHLVARLHSEFANKTFSLKILKS